MLEFLWILHTSYASEVVNPAIYSGVLSFKAWISIIALVFLFLVLISEKIDKAVISILVAWALIFLQVFTWTDSWDMSSQQVAGQFIYHNLDIFAFIIGMMILSGLAKWSGIFSYLAFSIVKKVKGNPKKVFFIFSYMAFFMTIFISNIPTIIILSPIVILITKKLEIPTLPYIIWVITFANLGGAVTPISDPTTYYQATTLWFGFWQVFSNTWLIMFLTTISSSIYLYIIFRKDFNVKPKCHKLHKVEPIKFLKKKKKVIISVSMLLIVILFILLKGIIFDLTGIKFDNWTIALFWAFLSVLLLRQNIRKVLRTKIDYVTLFFFAWLFIVVWALEYNWVIVLLAESLLNITWWNNTLLLFVITVGSSVLSVFIDNVPYNIAMVSTLEQFLQSGVVTWAAWTALAWGLNSCTSIGWAGSPIWSACNVIALWQAEKNGIVVNFLRFLKIGVPLVVINSFIAFWVLYLRYLF